MLATTLLLAPLTAVYWDSVDDFTADMKNQFANNPESILIALNGKYYTTSINPNLQQNTSGLYNIILNTIITIELNSK